MFMFLIFLFFSDVQYYLKLVFLFIEEVHLKEGCVHVFTLCCYVSNENSEVRKQVSTHKRVLGPTNNVINVQKIHSVP